jgi:DNA-directed RNA polymerase specialized sigma24 family protein
MTHVPFEIPTNQAFLRKWHWWIHKKVARHFKRDKERVFDTAQSVRLRLLSKDFIGRWFFKHLSEELVDTAEAEYMLGLTGITFNSEIDPAVGRRGIDGKGGTKSESWLWRVSDLLAYAGFDRERYYYSPQGHTIDSDRVLELLGYPARSYGILESLYRQGRLKPAELTEHACTGTRKCPGCVHGRATLHARGLSLINRWDDPSVEEAASKLRWNDTQLVPFLRNWRKKNRIQGPPRYIMRPEGSRGIDAGLLKYAQNVIDNEVVNDFKRLSRSADMSQMVFNNGMSPERSNSETIAWEIDEQDEQKSPVFCDAEYLSLFEQSERHSDIKSLICEADLTDEEEAAILAVDLMEMTARQYADSVGQAPGHVHSVRASAFRKLRGLRPDAEVARKALQDICETYGCTADHVLGPDLFGPCVRARTDLFAGLSDAGLSIKAMASIFSYPEDRIVAAINRKCLQEMRQS